MAPKIPSFAGLVVDLQPEEAPASPPVVTPPGSAKASVRKPAKGRGRPAVESTLRERSSQLVTYVNPEFIWALKSYAVEARCKPHDCILEAIEQWAKRKHIAVPVRALMAPGQVEDEG